MTEVALLQKLAEPFPPAAIKWKPGRADKQGARALAMPFADMRAYQDRLDEVIGLDWSVRYLPWGTDRIVAELTIAGVTRSSSGEMTDQDQKNDLGGTAAEAQAFKRACAMFGLGRYLYELPSVWVEYDQQGRRLTPQALAQLDGRYRAWYARKIATNAAETLAETLVGVGGEEAPAVDLPTATADEVFGFGLDTPVHQRLATVTGKCFGGDRDLALPWLLRTWTAKHSAPRRDALADLSLDEIDQLADEVAANCPALTSAWKRQKATELAKA